MKTALIITSAILGMALATPVAAHHNCAAGDACPDEIGDNLGMHELAYETLTDRMEDSDGSMTAAMDPADEDDRLPTGTGAWEGSEPTQSNW